MTNFKILLKNNWNILLGRLQGKKQRKSTIVASLLVVLGALAILGIYTFQTWTMFDGLGHWEFGKLCMFHACTTSISVLIIIGAMRITTKTNDSDLLLSLPIKKRDIVLSKALNLYVFDLFFVVMLFLPYLIIYQIKCRFDIQMLLLGLLLCFMLPLCSVGLTYILDFIVSKLYNKLKIGNLLKSVTLVLIFVVVLGLLLIKTSTYGTITSLDGYFEERPLSNTMLNFMFTPNFVNILLISLLTIGVFTVGIVLYIRTFGKNYVGYHSKNETVKFKEKSSSFGLLLKKEIFNYANTTAFIVNTIIGAILILALGIFISSTGVDGLSNLFGAEIPKTYLLYFLILIFCGASSTSTISSSTLSLEGKNFWILKSSPIKTTPLFLSKSILHIIIMEPFLIVSSVILSISLKLSFVEILALLIIPTLHICILAFGGLLINLWQPNFEWDDPTKVVKQSLSVLLSMILGALLTLALWGIYKLTGPISLAKLALLCGGVYVLILSIVILLLFTVGKKLYNKL